MKKVIFATVLALLSANLIAQEAKQQANIVSAPIGYTLTDFLAIDVLSGNALSVNQQINDNGLLVIFSCNTCPYVIKNIKRTDEILSKAKTLNIPVVIVNSNE